MSDSSIWPIDRALSGITSPHQNGVLSISQCSSNIFGLFSVISRSLVEGGVLPLCRDAVRVFYSPSWLGRGYSGMKYNLIDEGSYHQTREPEKFLTIPPIISSQYRSTRSMKIQLFPAITWGVSGYIPIFLLVTNYANVELTIKPPTPDFGVKYLSLPTFFCFIFLTLFWQMFKNFKLMLT